MVYVPLTVFGATDTFPSTSILNGPLVEAVTLVFAVVTATPFKVSFAKAFKATTTLLLEAIVTAGSLTASITFTTTTVAVAVSQLAGLTFAPVVRSASHNWYVIS